MILSDYFYIEIEFSVNSLSMKCIRTPGWDVNELSVDLIEMFNDQNDDRSDAV